MPHQTVFPKLVGTIDQIFPHQVLREGESRKCEILDNLEAGNVAHLLAHQLEDERHVDTAVVARQLVLKLGNSDLEIALEEFEQGRVDPYAVLVMGYLEIRSCRTALKLDRNKKQWGTVGPRVLLGLLPAQETRSEKKRVCTAFLQCRSWHGEIAPGTGCSCPCR